MCHTISYDFIWKEIQGELTQIRRQVIFSLNVFPRSQLKLVERLDDFGIEGGDKRTSFGGSDLHFLFCILYSVIYNLYM